MTGAPASASCARRSTRPVKNCAANRYCLEEDASMTGAILLLICLILIGLSIRSFQIGLRRAQTERVLGRLAEGQPQLVEENSQWSGVERMFLRAGLGKPSDNLGLWLAIWAQLFAFAEQATGDHIRHAVAQADVFQQVFDCSRRR